jgi:transcriptional regulator with XRE-family HTH domain
VSAGRPRRPKDPVPDLSHVRVEKLGLKLRALRTQRGWTQADVAAALGLKSQGHVSAFETGKKLPIANYVLALAALFGVSSDYLLRDDQQSPAPDPSGPNASTLPPSTDDRRYAAPDGG